MSKLADIEAAVAEYNGYAAKDGQEGYNYWLSRYSEEYAAKFAKVLPDLVAVVKAAQAVRAVRHDLIIDPSAALNNPQLETRLGNATRAMNELMVLVAKLEGE